MHEYLIAPQHPVPASSRLADRIWSTEPAAARIALIGLPDDRGVEMNGGRVGARGGPAAFRAALARYGAAEANGVSWPGVCDVGDVQPGSSLKETHDRVTSAVSAVIERGLFPVGIGGGHDLTFAFVRAVALREHLDAGVYFDAHLDVRVEEGSGMPFRRLVEVCGIKALHAHGLDPYANTGEHMQWFRQHGGKVGGFGPGEEWPLGALFASFDLDVIDQAFAPGVSAGNPCGWTPELADRWARSAGACERVRCFDIMELNPSHDEGGRTARLAVRLLLAFLSGYVERKP
ncbi:MAG: formimidoylglutamase [Phycisphaerales bacterium]|nr:formimidoylglutamase [Phycisphaerales bacterium]